MDDISMDLEVDAEDVETTWEVEAPLIERDFKETLTKEQLLGLVNDRIKPDHWQDGVVSYFRVHKLIEMLKQENLPLKPNFDVALEVLSDGKAKYNQHHRYICKYIQFQVEHQVGRDVEELQGPVERLVPGCFPIGPECESLGITGNVLVSEDATFPEPLDPKRITNRVLFELGQYVARIRQGHKDMDVWFRKILGLSGEEKLTGEMVSRWCNMVSSKTNQKKQSSMSLAQQYLEEQFTFPGLDLSKCLAAKTDKAETSQPELSSTKETEEANSELTSTKETKKVNGYMEKDNNDVVMDETILVQTPESKSADIADATDPDEKMDTENATPSSPTDGNIENESTSPSEENANLIAEKASTEDKLATEVNEVKSDSETAANDDTPPASTTERKSSRASAIVAKTKFQPLKSSKTSSPSTSDRKTQSVNESKKRVLRKPVQKKDKTVKIAKATKRKISKQEEEEAEEEIDDEEEEEEEEEEEGSEEEPQKSGRKQSSRKVRPHSSSSDDKNSVGRNLTEAAKCLESVFTRIKNLKKEMKIAIDYLEDESKKVKKELDGVKRQIGKSKMPSSGGKKSQKIESEDEEEEAEEETSEEEDEVDSEDEKPKSKRGRTAKTKKITVQVPQGVKKRLREPVLQLTPLTCGNTETSESEAGESDAESEQVDRSTRGRKTPSRGSKTSTPKARSKAGKAVREVSSEDEQLSSPATRSKPGPQSSKSPASQKSSRRGGKDERGNVTRAKAVPVRGTTCSPAKAGPASRASRSVLEAKSELSSGEVDFDKNKLFSSKVCVSLVKLDVDSVGRLDDFSSSDDDEPAGPKATGNKRTPARGSKQQQSSKQSTKTAKNVIDVSSEEETGRSSRSSRATARKGGPKQKAAEEDSKTKAKKKPQTSAKLRNEEKVNKLDSRSSRAKSKRSIVTSDKESDDGWVSNASKPSPPKKSAWSLRQEKKSKPTAKSRDDEDSDDEEDSPIKRRGTKTSSRAGTKKTASGRVIHSDTSSDDSNDGDHKSKGKTQKSSAHAAAAKSAPGEWRGASKTERVKKRSLDDFVKSLNSSKRFKDESGKRTSPRKADGSGSSGSGLVQPTTSEDELHYGSEEEFGEDDFLEKATKKQLEEREKKAKEEREKEEREKSKELDDEQSNKAEASNEDVDDDDDEDDGDKEEEGDDKDDKKEEDEGGDKKNDEDNEKEDESGGNQKEEGTGHQKDNNESSEESQKDDKKDADAENEGQQDAASEDDVNKDATEEEASNTFNEEGAEWSEVFEEDGNLQSSPVEPMDTEDTIQVNGYHDPQDNHVGEEKLSQNGVEEDDPELDEFPGDSIIGQRIRHRRCSGQHGLYKWFEGEVLRKASSAELLKLDEAQFSHLNNLKTIYTVQHKNSSDLSHLALEVDWDEGNVKILS